jgi:hypothetical protein
MLLGHSANRNKARWNGGICFGRCARCGRDLVRTASGNWQVPRGYRIVWRATPQDAAAAALEDEGRHEPEIADPPGSEQLPEAAPVALQETVTFYDEGRLEELQDPDGTIAQDRDTIEAPGVFEWPLAAPRAPDARAYVEPSAEPEAVPEEPALPETPAEVCDFMDEEADDMEWADLRVHA